MMVQRYRGMVGTNPTGAYVLYSDYAALEQWSVELEEARDDWRRQWSLKTAICDQAEERIKELEAENAELRRRLQTGGLDN